MKDTVYLLFGRFQPPTMGHYYIINKMMNAAKKDNADYVVYASKVGPDKGKRYPLTWIDKKHLLDQYFGDFNWDHDEKIKTPFQALNKQHDLGYNKVKIFVGEDRYIEFSNRIAALGYSNLFDVIQIEQYPRFQQFEGTNARAAVLQQNIKDFQYSTGWDDKICRHMYSMVYMGLKYGTKSRKQISDQFT